LDDEAKSARLHAASHSPRDRGEGGTHWVGHVSSDSVRVSVEGQHADAVAQEAAAQEDVREVDGGQVGGQVERLAEAILGEVPVVAVQCGREEQRVASGHGLALECASVLALVRLGVIVQLVLGNHDGLFGVVA